MSTIDTSWNIEKYRTYYEMEHEWNLKKKFLLAHKEKFSEERLVPLANMFVNMYFLGCKYPEPVMELINTLSKGVAEKNEKWERQSFVLASTAVEEKVKARLNRGDQPSTSKGPINFVQSSNLSSADDMAPTSPEQTTRISDVKKKGDVWVRGQKRLIGPSGCKDDEEPSQLKKRCMERDSVMNYSFEHKRNEMNIRRVVDCGPFGKVVVFQSALAKEESPINVVERTASAAQMSPSFDYTIRDDGEVVCKLSLDGLYLATGEGKNQKSAKESACTVAIERLQETSFTIIVKASYVGSTVDRELNSNKMDGKEIANVDTPIADSNIGSKLLKLMGWTGGGLGKNEQGIEEPVRPYDCNVRRGGLGISNFSDFRKKIIEIIKDFAIHDTKEDLVFSPEFTKDERKVIHELVRKYNLKSRSFGKEEENRRLVVFKKIRPLEIVEDLMNCGGETEKYKLITPSSVNCN